MKARHAVVADSEEPEHQLYEALMALRNIEEAKIFFDDLCTPTERQAMADRWIVVSLIKDGLPYRRIYEQTRVSVTTIGQVARCLSLGAGYELVYERIKGKQHATKCKTHISYPEKRSIEQ